MRLVAVVASLLLAGCLAPASDTTQGTRPPPAIAPSVLDPEGIELETARGNITILLYREAAPRTVALMEQLVVEGYYDGRSFGRIVPGHVIQITDLTPNGATEDLRRVPLEVEADYQFAAGAVGTARDVEPGSGGPEFFIMDFATSHLNGNYTVWGQVVEGMDVVRTIARGAGFDAPDLPPPLDSVFPFDRMALPPEQILSARLVTPEIAMKDRPDYPLQVARNVRVGDMRHSLEWHHGLRAGHESDLTWFIRPYTQDPVPDASTMQLLVDGQAITVEGDPTLGVYHFGWVPSRPGGHELTMTQSGSDLATLIVIVE